MTAAELITELNKFEPHTLVIDVDGLTPNFVELESDCAVLVFDPEAQPRKLKLINILRDHAWQLTPEQQFKLAVIYMLKMAPRQEG